MAELSREEKQRLLAAIPLFRGLPAEDLDGLVSIARTQALAKREQLFHKGDEGSQIYAVVSGKLKALTTSGEGDDVVFSILGPREVIGEISLLAGTARTATVSAIDPCLLLKIERRDFLSFLREHPEVATNLLAVMARRLKRVSELLEDTLFLNLPIRLAKKLTTLAHDYGEKTDSGTRINLKLSQEEWGDLVGTTRESVNKQIRTWTEEGLISVDRGYIVIHRPTDLEKLAGAVVL